MRLADIAEKLPAAGLGLGAVAWGTSTELNYALAPKVCVTHWPLVPVAALVLALITAFGLVLSAIALRGDRAQRSPDAPEGGAPHKLLALVGVLAGALFFTIIILQGVAGLFLNGCE